MKPGDLGHVENRPGIGLSGCVRTCAEGSGSCTKQQVFCTLFPTISWLSAQLTRMDTGTTPELRELYQLAQQLEHDRSVPLRALRERDRAIGARCEAPDDVGRLQFWLRTLPALEGGDGDALEGWLSRRALVIIARFSAILLGFMGMMTFLLASGRGLVNVLLFLALFVLVQFVFSLVALCALFLSARSEVPVLLPLNPARLFVSRIVPDKRYLRECQSVVRMLLLRYGQEIGALFTLGALAGFFAVLAFSDFTFVWGSTFNISDGFMRRFTDAMSAPWSSWLPGASLPGDIISASRYHPALTDLSQSDLASMRGWWPFLVMAMATYALLPRLVLWLLSKLLYVRSMRRSFARYPGSETVLARMKAPVIRTQAREPEQRATPGHGAIALNESLMLLNWAGALSEEELPLYEEPGAVPPQNMLSGGLGSLTADSDSARQINQYQPELLLVAVKSWEPPMADLQDFLGMLPDLKACKLCLVPLPGRSVAAHSLQDWRDFARELPFAVSDAQEMTRL